MITIRNFICVPNIFLVRKIIIKIDVKKITNSVIKIRHISKTKCFSSFFY